MSSERERDAKDLADESEEGDVQEDDDVEEAAEVLMTDMTLDDDMDKIRDRDPGSTWVYHIEAYPWHSDDVNERFIRLMKLATFTNLSVRKKPISHEAEDPERIDDKVMERQRKGSLHLYAESYQTAKSILRHSIWNNMVSKELTFEITKRNLDTGMTVTARIDVDTGSMSKIKFRNKTKGHFSARTAKVSNLPGEVTRDIIDIVFCRSYVAYSGPDTESNKDVKDVNPQQTLAEIPGFDGSLDVDCLTRGSCRSLVLSLKSVCVMGNNLSIVANDSQTMVIPTEPLSVTVKPKEESNAAKPADVGMTGYGIQVTTSSASRGREVRNSSAAIGRTGSLTRINSPVSHLVQSARIHPLNASGRPRGMGVAKGMGMTVQQPASASFTRSGQGMPVPMTGRQKMNEKIRRNHPNVVMGAPNTGVHPPMTASAGFRATNMRSIGDSFKQEIASLQSELERSTQAIEAKIERLKEESSYYSGYTEEMQMYMEGDWDQSHSYDYDHVGHEEYFDDGQSDYYAAGGGYDVVLSHDAQGYELPYQQQPPIESMVPVVVSSTSSRGGMPARRGPGRGGHMGIVRIPGGQRVAGLLGNNSGMASGRNPPPPPPLMRSMRGRGGGGGGSMYHGATGSSGGYW